MSNVDLEAIFDDLSLLVELCWKLSSLPCAELGSFFLSMSDAQPEHGILPFQHVEG